MASIRGTQTETNLMAAFAGESQARNRYDIYAAKAVKEGYEAVAAVFTLTAEQERQHAKKLFSFLAGGEVTITGTFPAGTVGTTAENLRAAAEGEDHETRVMYPEFARTAREEGFENIARLFENIAVAEAHHCRQFLELAEKIESGRIFKGVPGTQWVCRKCGFVHEGEEAPDFCPACSHPKAYFEELR